MLLCLGTRGTHNTPTDDMDEVAQSPSATSPFLIPTDASKCVCLTYDYNADKINV